MYKCVYNYYNILFKSLIIFYKTRQNKNTKDPQKKGKKNGEKGSKQEPLFLGHKLNFHRGEYSKHPPKTSILVLRKRCSPNFAPSFAKSLRTFILTIML